MTMPFYTIVPSHRIPFFTFSSFSDTLPRPNNFSGVAHCVAQNKPSIHNVLWIWVGAMLSVRKVAQGANGGVD